MAMSKKMSAAEAEHQKLVKAAKDAHEAWAQAEAAVALSAEKLAAAMPMSDEDPAE